MAGYCAYSMSNNWVIKGNWFYRKDGSKKGINANGFMIIEKL